MGALVHASKNDKITEEEAEDVSLQGEQYLTLLISDEIFAIGIVDIKEIIEYQEPTTVPMMPSFIRGVLNLRGRVVPVIDLLVRFGRDSTEVSRRTCIVILEVYHDDEQQYIGIVVDAVKAVLDIADEDIEPPPSFGAKLRSDFVSGMGKVKGEFVIILDTGNVLSIEELSQLAGLDEESNQLDGPEYSMLTDETMINEAEQDQEQQTSSDGNTESEQVSDD